MARVSAAVTEMTSLCGLDPDSYEPHALHRTDRSYVETNCYTDILVELLHARGLEPLAGMGFTIGMDFEGDQWTFFKPPPADLELLFGVDIHEMQPYRSLPDQISEQLQRGRTMILELDAWYLPDTAATSYGRAHVKTSVAVEGIDGEHRRLRYFHNAGLYELGGGDYEGVFRLTEGFGADVLPPYTELVRFDAGGGPQHGQALVSAARGLLRTHLDACPDTDPFERFGAQLAAELPALLDGDPAYYHDYVFATLRMAGSAFEVCASHVAWALGAEAAPAVAALGRIVDGCKLLSFKLARRRQFDPVPVVAELSQAWREATAELDAALA